MYKLFKDINDSEVTNVQRLSDGAMIPFAAGNKDYQEYLRWVSEGNVPISEDSHLPETL